MPCSLTATTPPIRAAWKPNAEIAQIAGMRRFELNDEDRKRLVVEEHGQLALGVATPEDREETTLLCARIRHVQHRPAADGYVGKSSEGSGKVNGTRAVIHSQNAGIKTRNVPTRHPGPYPRPRLPRSAGVLHTPPIAATVQP